MQAKNSNKAINDSIKAICQNIATKGESHENDAIDYINHVDWQVKTKNFDKDILKMYVREVPVYYLSYWKNAVSAAYERQEIDNKYRLPNGHNHEMFKFGIKGIEKWLKKEIAARLQYVEFCAVYNKEIN